LNDVPGGSDDAFPDYNNPDKQHFNACFSMDVDSRFVFGGSYEGLIHVWDMHKSEKVRSLKSGYEGYCDNVGFNPKFMNLVTSGKQLHLWIEKD
jgi:WD40 repeat protein